MLKTNGRRWWALLLAALLLLGSLPTALAAEGNTVNVSSAEELLRVVKQCSLDSWSRGRTIVLTADLDLKSAKKKSRGKLQKGEKCVWKKGCNKVGHHRSAGLEKVSSGD